MTAGRPTKYTEELLKNAHEYINGGWKTAGHAIPSACGMAVELNVSESRLYVWAADPEKEFKEILEKCKTNQKLTLLNGGLSNDLNPTITKLVLGKHGYHEKQDVAVTDKTPTPEKRKSRIEELLGKCQKT